MAKSKNSYAVSISLDKEYKGSGKTLKDALKSVPVPVKIVSKGMVKVTYGEKRFEEMWMPDKLKRLFQPLSQEVQAKQLDYLMR